MHREQVKCPLRRDLISDARAVDPDLDGVTSHLHGAGVTLLFNMMFGGFVQLLRRIAHGGAHDKQTVPAQGDRL
jgi:hypothetical protein